MGGNARKRRIVAATRHAAKEKAATKKSGPTTKVDPNAKEEIPHKAAPPPTQNEPRRPKSTWTGKSPLDLLHEHLQKNKWARVRWKEQDTRQDMRGQPIHTWKVNLFNPKTEERLFFRTAVFEDEIDPNDTTEQTWQWPGGAKQNCALVALSHFFPNQPLHNHIAHEFRPVWHHLQDRQKQQAQRAREREERDEK